MLILCEVSWSVWRLRSEARPAVDTDTPDGMEENLLSDEA